MKQKKYHKYLFVINPISGAEEKDDVVAKISRYMDELDHSREIFFTTGENDGEKITNVLNRFKPQAIVVAGGDGTVNLVGSILVKHKGIHMGIIPAGSANGLAYNLDLSTDFEESLERILHAEPKPIDVIQINQRWYCLHLSDIGINARIVKRFEQEGSKGLGGYAKQLIKELFSKSTAFSYSLEASGTRKHGHAEMLVFANARSFGTGAVINPEGKPDDGKFEIIIIKPYPWWMVFRFIWLFITGDLDNMRYLEVIPAREATIKLMTFNDIQIDGEIKEGIKEVHVKILPGALHVLY